MVYYYLLIVERKTPLMGFFNFGFSVMAPKKPYKYWVKNS
jgi:hypothetical protein